MKKRVLIVDDSSFIRRILTDIIDSNPYLEVIGTASNGREAIMLAKTLSPDVITMDIEMPIMDGITAVKEIMAIKPTPILMFSSLTKVGAKSTLEALEAGALDYLPKSLTDISGDTEHAKRMLCARIRIIAAKGIHKGMTPSASKEIQEDKHAQRASHAKSHIVDFDPSRYKHILIGTSTGGPAALQKILTALPASFPVPIVVIQHMPESFTGPFADRLNSLSAVNIKLAHDGDELRPGYVYIAPGGHQLTFSKRSANTRIVITRASEHENYKPSVDITFSSAAEQGLNDVLAVVLTGMGSDGTEGAKKLKDKKATIWAQDKDSSIVYGMPMSINNAGLSDSILSLNDITEILSHGA